MRRFVLGWKKLGLAVDALFEARGLRFFMCDETDANEIRRPLNELLAATPHELRAALNAPASL